MPIAEIVSTDFVLNVSALQSLGKIKTVKSPNPDRTELNSKQRL